ncbi:hypothetical protein S245_004115, partial [Arachis hypogaea]
AVSWGKSSRRTGTLSTSDTQIQTLLIGDPCSILEPFQMQWIATRHLRGYCTGCSRMGDFQLEFLLP